MEKTYHILCWIVLLCAALVLSIPVICFTGLGIFFLCKLTEGPESVGIGLLTVLSPVCYVFLVWAGRRFLFRPDRLSEPSDVSRGASVALWLGFAFLLCLAFFWLGWHLEKDFLLLGIPAVLILAPVMGCCFPFRRHVNGTAFAVLGPLTSFLIFSIGVMLIGRNGKPLDYTGDKVSEIPYLSSWQKDNYFPVGAVKIKVHGQTTCFEWECRLSEKDFLNYMKKSRFIFQKFTKPDIRMKKAPYYQCVDRRGDGGGVSLFYSVPEQKFSGSYSDH